MATTNSTLPAAQSGLPAWLRNRWGIAAALATLYLLVYIAWTFFKWGGHDNQALISNLAFLPMSLFASIAAWRVAADSTLDRRLRQAWLILGLSVFAYFLGDLVWFFIESVLGQSPFPSLADVFYLLFYPLALAGLLALPGGPISRAERFKFLLDMAIVMTAAWMVVWFFVISPSTSVGGEDSSLAQIISAAYPIADLVAMAGIVWLLLRKIEPALRSALVLFMVGLLAFVVTDLLFAYSNLTNTYESGGWIDVGWVAAYWLFALAALRQRYPASEHAPDGWSAKVLEWLPLVLPFLAIGLGYGMVLVIANDRFALGVQVQGLFVGAGLLTAFVVGRQVVTLRDNMTLNTELRTISGELEHRVEERTRELQQSQEALLASQKLASTGAMAAGIAHEVGNPLNTIAAASEALQFQIDDNSLDLEALKEYVPVIHRAVWHAARIVQTLRNFSRGSQPELVPQSLEQVLDDALFLMTYQIEHWPKIKVTTSYTPDLPAVLCDRNQVAQVLINLLTNARDAMPNGGTIQIRTLKLDDKAVFEVQDEGAGIPAEELSKILAPFFTTKPIGKGSGLGLSIVSGIVRDHHGTLTVLSEGLGKGATFRVVLPFAESSHS